VVLPGAGEDAARGFEEELIRAVDPALAPRGALAQWHPGETGDDVLDRARAELETIRIPETA
jgi:hypothetical protein